MIGININDSTQPFTEQILNGEKTIDTRDTFNNALQNCINHGITRVAIVRTGVKNTKVVGYMTISFACKYSDKESFQKDYPKHLVKPNSKFDIKTGGVKYGYYLSEVVRENSPFPPLKVGIKTSVAS